MVALEGVILAGIVTASIVYLAQFLMNYLDVK